MALSNKYKKVLKEMDGQEIRSLFYEDVIGIEGNKIWSNGKIIDVINTDSKVRRLIKEAYYDEFGTNKISEALF
jgi:hypothetical protein